MKHSESIAQIAAALAAAQGEFRPAAQSGTNPHLGNSYATLGDVMKACRDALAKNGLALVQGAASDGNAVVVTTLLTHASGEWFEETLRVPFGDGKGLNSAQVMGSALSYGRRYGASALLGITVEDDDASSLTTRSQQGQRRQQPPAPREQYQERRQAPAPTQAAQPPHQQQTGNVQPQPAHPHAPDHNANTAQAAAATAPAGNQPPQPAQAAPAQDGTLPKEQVPGCTCPGKRHYPMNVNCKAHAGEKPAAPEVPVCTAPGCGAVLKPDEIAACKDAGLKHPLCGTHFDLHLLNKRGK
jgi:hypothetical protein